MTRRVPVWVFAVLVLAAPLRAGEPEPYLPVDTEVCLQINVKQILGSKLFRKHGVEQIRGLLLTDEKIAALLEALKFDPLEDVERIVVGLPAAGDQDRGLMVLRGRFQPESFLAVARKHEKEGTSDFCVLSARVGDRDIDYCRWRTRRAGQRYTLYAGFASSQVLLVSPLKEYLFQGMQVREGTKPALKNRAFLDVLGRVDAEQSLSVAVAGEALHKGFADASEEIREVVGKLSAIVGGLTLTDGARLEVRALSRDAESARSLRRGLNRILAGIRPLLAEAAANQPPVATALEVVKKLAITVESKSVVVTAEMDRETLFKLLSRDEE